MSDGGRRERLEAPSGELKMLRKQLLVEKLMNTSTKSTTGMDDSATTTQGTSSDEGGIPKKVFKLGPSSVLSRVRDFLPQMKSANDQLSRLTDLTSVSVEAEIREEEEGLGNPFIEMNLAFMPQPDSSDESDFEKSVSSDSEGDGDERGIKFRGAKDDLENPEGSLPSKANGNHLISELDD